SVLVLIIDAGGERAGGVVVVEQVEVGERISPRRREPGEGLVQKVGALELVHEAFDRDFRLPESVRVRTRIRERHAKGAGAPLECAVVEELGAQPNSDRPPVEVVQQQDRSWGADPRWWPTRTNRVWRGK